MLTEQTVRELELTARQLRVEILKMLNTARSGHTGGSLSAIDVLTVLYFHKMRHDPSNPAWEDRDRFVLSKGHAAPALYACLAEAGYFSARRPEESAPARQPPAGAPRHEQDPGVEVCTGSLGQGLSQAVGLALAGRLKRQTSRVYTLLGDGELQEGQVWEAAMAAAHYRLDNLCAIIDPNGLQIDGEVAKVMNVGAAGAQVSRLQLARAGGGRPRHPGHQPGPGRCREDRGAADDDHRPHRQGQGGSLLRAQGELPRRAAQRRRAGPGPWSTWGMPERR